LAGSRCEPRRIPPSPKFIRRARAESPYGQTIKPPVIWTRSARGALIPTARAPTRRYRRTARIPAWHLREGATPTARSVVLGLPTALAMYGLTCERERDGRGEAGDERASAPERVASSRWALRFRAFAIARPAASTSRRRETAGGPRVVVQREIDDDTLTRERNLRSDLARTSASGRAKATPPGILGCPAFCAF
jgi:hypothetical protein